MTLISYIKKNNKKGFLNNHDIIIYDDEMILKDPDNDNNKVWHNNIAIGYDKNNNKFYWGMITAPLRNALDELITKYGHRKIETERDNNTVFITLT